MKKFKAIVQLVSQDDDGNDFIESSGIVPVEAEDEKEAEAKIRATFQQGHPWLSKRLVAILVDEAHVGKFEIFEQKD